MDKTLIKLKLNQRKLANGLNPKPPWPPPEHNWLFPLFRSLHLTAPTTLVISPTFFLSSSKPSILPNLPFNVILPPLPYYTNPLACTSHHLNIFLTIVCSAMTSSISVYHPFNSTNLVSLFTRTTVSAPSSAPDLAGRRLLDKLFSSGQIQSCLVPIINSFLNSAIQSFIFYPTHCACADDFDFHDNFYADCYSYPDSDNDLHWPDDDWSDDAALPYTPPPLPQCTSDHHYIPRSLSCPTFPLSFSSDVVALPAYLTRFLWSSDSEPPYHPPHKLSTPPGFPSWIRRYLAKLGRWHHPDYLPSLALAHSIDPNIFSPSHDDISRYRDWCERHDDPVVDIFFEIPSSVRTLPAFTSFLTTHQAEHDHELRAPVIPPNPFASACPPIR